MIKNLLLRMILVAVLISMAALAFGADTSTHTLQKGETLYSLSKLYKVPYEALVSANGISDPTKLKIGTVLMIPLVHQVAKGETLFGLSRQYGITIAELLSANRLTQSYVLKIGDTLIIPAKKQDTIQPTTTSTANTVATTTTTPPTTLTTSAGLVSSTTLAAHGETPLKEPMPEPVKTQSKTVDLSMGWPAQGKVMYLDGKLEGVMILAKTGDATKAIAGGTVVSAGPSRGFNQVVFVQAKSGYVYVYGGNESLLVKTGDTVQPGKELGKIGVDTADGAVKAYFFVFRNGQPIDPALAPRD